MQTNIELINEIDRLSSHNEKLLKQVIKLKAQNNQKNETIKTLMIYRNNHTDLNKIAIFWEGVTGMRIEEIKSRARDSAILFGRYYFIYLCSKVHEKHIAEFLNQHRTTILAARKTIKTLIETKNENFAKYIL